MDLTEAEDIKKMWQEYPGKLYNKGLNDPDNHNIVITHLKPVILACEIKWFLRSITTNKGSSGDRIPAKLFQTLKFDKGKSKSVFLNYFYAHLGIVRKSENLSS